MKILNIIFLILLIIVVLAVGGYFGTKYYLSTQVGPEYLFMHPTMAKVFGVTPVCSTICIANGGVCGQDGKNYCNECIAFQKGAGYAHDGACITAGWIIYKNTKYGFEISHPASCKEDAAEQVEGYFDYNRTQVLTITCGDTKWTGPNVISFYIDPSDKNIQNCLSGEGMVGSNSTKENLNGFNFDYWSGSDAAMGGQRQLDNNYAIVYNNKCIQIISGVRYEDLSFLAGVSSQKFTADDQKQHDAQIQQMGDMMNKIISTFKFTK